MFKSDGNVLHFSAPKGMSRPPYPESFETNLQKSSSHRAATLSLFKVKDKPRNSRNSYQESSTNSDPTHWLPSASWQNPTNKLTVQQTTKTYPTWSRTLKKQALKLDPTNWRKLTNRKFIFIHYTTSNSCHILLLLPLRDLKRASIRKRCPPRKNIRDSKLPFLDRHGRKHPLYLPKSHNAGEDTRKERVSSPNIRVAHRVEAVPSALDQSMFSSPYSL
jgi:hypothetical protein